ncbi:MAG TPA: hypothetical protein VIF62_15635 [Labilithrix sp.]|jgi:hypothetical protein
MNLHAGWLVAYFFAGAFVTNAFPHLASGLMGRAFQSPFARPPGQGLSSSRVNFFWGFANLVLGWVLVARVGAFDPRDAWHVAALGLGSLAIGAFCAHHFGRFHGGNTSRDT